MSASSPGKQAQGSMAARRIAWAMFWCIMGALIAWLAVPRLFSWPACAITVAAALVVGVAARIRLRMTGGRI